MRSSERRASSTCDGSNSQRRSRPTLTWRTRPACASTCRCLVTACRVISVPEVSCAIDRAEPAHRTATSRRRVSSPSAAKIGAAPRSDELRSDELFSGADLAGAGFEGGSFAAVLRLGDMLLDVLHLDGPAAAVHA